MTVPAATIVVCTRDRSASLEEALSDLVDQSISDRSPGYEILVVDDGSTDDTAMVVERVDHQSPIAVRRVSGDGRGVAHARNVGVAEARGLWIAFFDDDQRTGPTWLAELLDAAERTGADLVGGPIEVSLPDGASVGPVVRAIYGEHPTERQRRRGIIPLPGGGNRLVHRRVFDRIGLHDESMSVGEDTDLIARAAAAHMDFGWAPRAIVRHLIPDERLDPQTMFAYARGMGEAKAQTDFKRLGRWRTVRSATVVLAKAGTNAVLILLAMLRRSRVDVLDCRTRSWVFSGYLASALRTLYSGDPSR